MRYAQQTGFPYLPQRADGAEVAFAFWIPCPFARKFSRQCHGCMNSMDKRGRGHPHYSRPGGRRYLRAITKSRCYGTSEKPEYRCLLRLVHGRRESHKREVCWRGGFEVARMKPIAFKTVASNEPDEVWSATGGTEYEKTYKNDSSTRSSGRKSGNQDEVVCSDGVESWVSFPKLVRVFLRIWKFRL